MSDAPLGPAISQYLAERKQLVDTHLERFLPPKNTRPRVIHEAMRYSLFAGGKRLRPILALATSELLRGQFDQAIQLACALEMIHTYSLIHDDLPAMDNDDYRRGHLTCHKKFGEAFAILAGNGLLTRAFQLLSEIPGGSPEVKLRVIDEICSALGTEGGVIAGQVLDLATQGRPFAASDLKFIHSSKTGALFAASVYTAALLAGAPAKLCEDLKEFGEKLGLTFQIVDDILDVEGTSAELGKTSGKDAKELKATYPALYGLEKSKAAASRLANQAIRKLSRFGPEGNTLRDLTRFISIRRF